jgi:prepilin-type N-terminal cleavage/methylation domain-containing protein
MFNSICNRKGITLIEVLVSVVLISVGVMALLTLLPSGWRLSGTSDLLGRAAAILQGEMERNEILVMNVNNTVTATPPGAPETRTVHGSGRDTAQPGDIPYVVQTERTDLGGTWRVRVWVTWPGNTRGISESLIVARHRNFAQ